MVARKSEACRSPVIHEKQVREVRRRMPAARVLGLIGDFFKVLGDPTRLKIINALFLSEMCVCDLSAALDMNVPAISHQLKTLKEADLVRFRREGKAVYYSLKDEHVRVMYRQGLLHVREREGDR